LLDLLYYRNRFIEIDAGKKEYPKKRMASRRLSVNRIRYQKRDGLSAIDKVFRKDFMRVGMTGIE